MSLGMGKDSVVKDNGNEFVTVNRCYIKIRIKFLLAKKSPATRGS